MNRFESVLFIAPLLIGGWGLETCGATPGTVAIAGGVTLVCHSASGWLAGSCKKLNRSKDRLRHTLFHVVSCGWGTLAMQSEGGWLMLGEQQLYERTTVPDLGFITVSFFTFQTITWMVDHVFTLLWRERGRDHSMLVVHHCVTLLLSGACCRVGAADIGLAVMQLHDWSDILMDLCKILNQTKTRWGNRILYGLFPCMLVVWMKNRLMDFPALIWMLITTPPPASSVQHTGLSGENALRLMHMFVMLLIVLVILHAFWFGMLIQIAIGMIAGHDPQRATRRAVGRTV